jgi:hypothetical protein
MNKMLSGQWLVEKILFILFLGIGVQTTSCTHWLIETETRIQVENSTDVIISDLCIVSKNGQKIVLIPGGIEIGKKSIVYEIELTGEFNFGVHYVDSLVSLGIYKLKGGSVLARITGESGKFAMVLK